MLVKGTDLPYRSLALFNVHPLLRLFNADETHEYRISQFHQIPSVINRMACHLSHRFASQAHSFLALCPFGNLLKTISIKLKGSIKMICVNILHAQHAHNLFHFTPLIVAILSQCHRCDSAGACVRIHISVHFIFLFVKVYLFAFCLSGRDTKFLSIFLKFRIKEKPRQYKQ